MGVLSKIGYVGSAVAGGALGKYINDVMEKFPIVYYNENAIRISPELLSSLEPVYIGIGAFIGVVSFFIAKNFYEFHQNKQ